MEINNQQNAKYQEAQESNNSRQCCFDYNLRFETNGRNKRDVLLSILIAEETIELFRGGGQQLRVGVSRCDLTMDILNGELPLETRVITNPLTLSEEVSYKKSSRARQEHRDKYELKGSLEAAAVPPNINAEARWMKEQENTDSHDTTRSHTTTEYSVESGGTQTNPKWIFRSRDNSILRCGLTNQALGQIKKTGSACQIEADCRSESKDIVITDAMGVLAQSVTKHKLLKSFVLKVVGMQPVSIRRMFEVI